MWLTPDSIPTVRTGRCIFLPDSPEWRGAFYGAIAELYKEYNWEKSGTLTPIETSYEWLDVIADFLEMPMSCIAIGSIVDYAGSGDLPFNYLECDGSEILITDYASLYDVIGDTFGTATSGYFKLPDMRARVSVGVGDDGEDNYAMGDIGGESTHILTADELPEHYHIYNEGTTSAIINGENVPVTVVTVNAPSNTSVVGNDDAHENRMKYIALRKCIIAL